MGSVGLGADDDDDDDDDGDGDEDGFCGCCCFCACIDDLGDFGDLDLLDDPCCRLLLLLDLGFGMRRAVVLPACAALDASAVAACTGG